ncbi:hypothetical protein G9464_08580 [Halostella sp. JP-L12]|uniref:hypothetical protein n=1 Tax=Halostella TaxID=1843185 RepID=UPI000EF7C52D|nr:MULTISPECIES: hypothetical protein [Halostella]NHN47651.1 hypothetical protein [Halostella sp. JP-L12]
MGLLDRLLEPLGDGTADDGGDDPDAPPRPSTGDRDAKRGSHGSHWDALVDGDEAIGRAVQRTIETGDAVRAPPVDGREVVGFRAGEGPVRSTAVTADGEMLTAYPELDGIAQEFAVDEEIPWANGVEAQFRGRLGPASAAFFPTDFYAEGGERDGDRRVELAGLAYYCAPQSGASDDAVADVDGAVGGEGADDVDGNGGVVGFAPFDRGDVDDYVFRTRAKEVTATTFDGRAVYRIRAPLFRRNGEDVDVSLYAADRVLDGVVPEAGDHLEGVLWLQGRTE